MRKFTEKLKQLRLEKDLCLIKLSKATNISRTKLCNWETGKSIPRAKDFVTLVKFFDVSADYLLGIDK